VFKNFIAKVETIKNGLYDEKKLESFFLGVEKRKKMRAEQH